ncbi:glycerol uptake facilitator-like aquaporin [Mycoplasmopsis mustelae]|uniref:Glycerol uptake facilitator-like aquaporin n=1 Tax=Mycoplasmopsis mustelae TaxID=171289 RepID=A0A4R7UC47_9BACT|nr:aquaporin [Mycoplasmopsis mustelae]TDV23258.1 glycerol uptake facilitator-like aquaporin [Mycoplasmopsis mustelae]
MCEHDNEKCVCPDRDKKIHIFSYFKLKRLERFNAEKPKDIKTWIIHGLSEFFGTIMLSLLLAGLSTVVGSRNGKPIVIEHFLLHPVFVGFYAGFIAVGLILIIFLRWSSDLNPAVSIFRYLNGSQAGWYVSYKIFIQILGSIVAAAMIFGVGRATANSHPGYLSNLPWDAISSTKKAFYLFRGDSTSTTAIYSGSTWIFFIEMIMTSILLFPIFSPNIKNKYRDLFIMFIISLSVWMGILSGTAAINPFRGLAQQLSLLAFEPNPVQDGYLQINNVVGGYFNLSENTNATTKEAYDVYYNSVVSATISMILGGLIAPLFYITAQGITRKWINPFIVSSIKYRNNKNECMEKCQNNPKTKK